MPRLIIDILMTFAIIHGWWFIALPIALVGALRYRWFFEMLIAGLAYDSLFGLVPEQGIYSYIGIISSLILFAAMMFLKAIMRK
ncbi:MAG: hypothetical protein RLY66_677 [Candidatus Parcubacteria bacterium]|jgi:hypothetical protein